MISIWRMSPVLIDGQYIFDDTQLTPRQYAEIIDCPENHIWFSEDKEVFKPAMDQVDRYSMITQVNSYPSMVATVVEGTSSTEQQGLSPTT